MMRDWHSMWLIRRGHHVHQATDPVCIFYRAPREGSRLDRVSRGWSCPRCASYIVGERGPELFIPKPGGQIYHRSDLEGA